MRRAGPFATPSLGRRALFQVFAGSALTALAGCNDGAPAVTTRGGAARTPTSFGSQVYEGDDVARSVGLLSAMGAKYARVSVQSSPAFLDAVVAAATAQRLRLIFISAYAPQPVDPAAYARAAVGVHTRYAAADPVWEIWNEPNLAQYWNGPPDVIAYLAVLNATAKALRAAGASDVWTGGTSGVDLNWLYNLASRGAYVNANGCAVHSYKPPGYARTEYIQAAGFLPAGVGLHTTETCIASSVGNQADYFDQMWYLHRELNLPTLVWCEFRDGGAGSAPPFNEPYGLVDAQYALKSVYTAAQQQIASND